MFDIICFQASDCKMAESADMVYININSLPRSVFSSVSSIERARVMAKRSRFVHMPLWPYDLGLARLLAEQDAVMVIGLSEIFGLPPLEMAKRISRTANMAKMVLHFGGRVRLASLAKNCLDLRNALEFASIGERLGIPAEIVLKELNAPIKE